MRPKDVILTNRDNNWCLSDGEDNYLVFALKGGRIDLNMSETLESHFAAKWFDPRKGILSPVANNRIVGGRKISFEAPCEEPLVLWLNR